MYRMQPQDRDGRMKLKECEGALRKKRFEEAIAAPEEETVKVSATVERRRHGHRLDLRRRAAGRR